MPPKTVRHFEGTGPFLSRPALEEQRAAFGIGLEETNDPGRPAPFLCAKCLDPGIQGPSIRNELEDPGRPSSVPALRTQPVEPLDDRFPELKPRQPTLSRGESRCRRKPPTRVLAPSHEDPAADFGGELR